VFRPAWTRALLERLLSIDTPRFAGTLSALYAHGELVAVHMGMRSRTVWHYWFPAYDPGFARYSPGLILLAAMLQAAPAAGLRRVDLGKGEALYKRRLMNAEVPIAEGRVELPSVTTRLRRLRRDAEDLVSHGPLAALLRRPGRLVKRLERRLRFA
jgi:CelD/BcsL family acetyltransferase involved in cellulose biosynthesis